LSDENNTDDGVADAVNYVRQRSGLTRAQANDAILEGQLHRAATRNRGLQSAYQNRTNDEQAWKSELDKASIDIRREVLGIADRPKFEMTDDENRRASDPQLMSQREYDELVARYRHSMGR